MEAFLADYVVAFAGAPANMRNLRHTPAYEAAQRLFAGSVAVMALAGISLGLAWAGGTPLPELFVPAALFAYAIALALDERAKRIVWLLAAAAILALLFSTGAPTTLTLILAPLAMALLFRRERVNRTMRLLARGPFAAVVTLAVAVAVISVMGANTQYLSERLALVGTSDVGSTVRARVTATNSVGSGSAASAQTDVVTAAPALATTPSEPAPTPTPIPTPTPPGFPASFFTGPLGEANILPAKTTGALLGTFGDGTWDQQKNQWLAREHYLGRQYDLYGLHYAAPTDSCDWGGTVAPYTGGREAWVVNRGGIPVVSWTHGWTIDAVNAGTADACIRAVARRAAAFGYRHLLRIYWEFNGGWFRWSGSGQTFIDAWRRTVRLFREESATNVGFVWSPDGGHRHKAFASYPGDDYVDWVGMSLYNMNKDGAWCSPYNSGPWCELAHVLSHDPVNYPTIYDRYSGQKPFMLGESGSVEDPLSPGRKGQWFRNARDKIKSCCPNLRGIDYFDVDLTETEGLNWRLDTSSSALEGFRDLALDPFFRTQPDRVSASSAKPESRMW